MSKVRQPQKTSHKQLGLDSKNAWPQNLVHLVSLAQLQFQRLLEKVVSGTVHMCACMVCRTCGNKGGQTRKWAHFIMLRSQWVGPTDVYVDLCCPRSCSPPVQTHTETNVAQPMWQMVSSSLCAYVGGLQTNLVHTAIYCVGRCTSKSARPQNNIINVEANELGWRDWLICLSTVQNNWGYILVSLILVVSFGKMLDFFFNAALVAI